MDPTGQLVLMDSVKLSKYDSLWTKAEAFRDYLDQLALQVSPRRVIVEANAKRFAPGFSSADVLFTLSKMNALCCWLAYEKFNVPIVDINVTSARAKLGLKIDRTNKAKSTKEKVREQLLVLYPNLPIKTHVAKTGKSKGQVVLDKENEDRLDAFVVCRGGQLLAGF